MAYAAHLYKVKDTYYFRLRVPRDLQSHFQRKELKRTLRTKSLRSAKTLLSFWSSRTEELFTHLRTGIMSEPQVQYLVHHYISQDLQSREVSKPSPVSAPSSPVPSGITLSKLTELYVKENMAQGNWSGKTRQELESLLNMFIEIFGDSDVKTIKRFHMVEYLEKMKKLPARRNLLAEYRDKSIDDLLAMAPFPRPLAIQTIRKRMVLISSLFKWAVKNEYMDRNPAEGLAPTDKRSDDEQRKVFDQGDIKKMVDVLNLKYKHMVGHPERWWVPIIILYSGMRVNEACQLYKEDVREIDGVWCFDINSRKDKQIKNKNSKRIVPVHPKLIELGFLDYYHSVQHERVWPALIRGANGYSHDFGKWFGKLNRRHITKDPGKVLYSLRHTFIDSLKQAEVNTPQIAELVGHAAGSISMERYGKKYKPRVQLGVLERLAYGIDI